MTYDPKTHLLRPLEPGEIIEIGDIFARGTEFQPTSDEGMLNIGRTHPYFRPVPRTTGWRPRSEAHLLKKEDVAVWKAGETRELWRQGHVPDHRWTHFYIIPPCDLPPPDPERERFEKWWKRYSAHDTQPDTAGERAARAAWLERSERKEAP